jgi:hypothetical protein
MDYISVLLPTFNFFKLLVDLTHFLQNGITEEVNLKKPGKTIVVINTVAHHSGRGV